MASDPPLHPDNDPEQIFKADKQRFTDQLQVKTEELARSQQELRALAGSLFASHERERRRLARELHDDVSQRLVALEIDADQVAQALQAGGEGAQEAMARIRERIARLSDDVRLMSHRLHPSVIEDLGLKTALRILTEEFREREEMIITFSPENVPDDIPLETATALYRIAQEALRNVAKHAGRTHTRISLKRTAMGLRLQVADFGNGFDMDARRQGLGLVSMEERARQIGGTLQLESALGQGTTVTVEIKLSPAHVESVGGS